MTDQTIYNSIFVLIIIVLLYFLAKYKYDNYRKNRARKKRFERGLKLEKDAQDFLKNKGYSIIGSQETFYHEYTVNGEHRKNKIIVDYVAKKKGKRYLVEVKSGREAISLNNSSSRRQLLEYDQVIENDGVILLDMESKAIQHVKFYSKEERRDEILKKIMFIIAVVGIIIPSIKIKILVVLLLAGIWLYPTIAHQIIYGVQKLRN